MQECRLIPVQYTINLRYVAAKFFQALVLASAANGTHLNMYKDIYLSTYGILFFGTPHQGGNGVSLGKFLVNVASIFTSTNKKLLKHLEMHSEWLLHQTAQYNAISAQFETKYIYETYKTQTPFGSDIVSDNRTSPCFSIPTSPFF